MSSNFALVHPNDLLASELREVLDRRRELWRRIDLLSDRDADVGSLTEVGGAAAMVHELGDASFDDIDVAIFGGALEFTRPLLKGLPASTAALVLNPLAGAADGHPVVAGINLDTVSRDRVMLSPHPGTVALAHLLHPLGAFGLRRASATLIQPVSVYGKEGLDEMFDQTRAILAFSQNPEHEVFPTQMAFNMLPSQDPYAPVAEHLATVLGDTATGGDIHVSVQVLQAAIFHSYGISLHLELENDPGPEAVAEAYDDHPYTDRAVDPELLGPIDAANRDEVLVGPIEADPRQKGSYRLWAVMDNLTCGGALNALKILEALGPSTVH